MTTMSYTRITTATGSYRAGVAPAINENGTKIVFASDYDLLNAGIEPSSPTIWLYDTVAMTHTRITTSTPSGRFSFYPVINADGSKIAFLSDSDLLDQGVEPNEQNIWLAELSYTVYHSYLPIIQR